MGIDAKRSVPKGITIIIPAYNEEKSINNVISDIRKILSVVEHEAEIIVVDDASTDGTRLRARESGVKVISHFSNQGYGASIKHGISRASYDMILIIDADGTYSPAQIPELLKWCTSSDMVVGTRTTQEVHIPFLRKPAKWILNKLANYLTGISIPDINSGMRLFRRDTVKRFLSILPSGFSFTTTLTLAMLCNNYDVKYVPINYYHRTGKSKIRPISDTLNFLQLIIRTVLYFNPLKIFFPVGILLIFIAIAVFIYSYYFTSKIMDITIIVIVLAAIQVFTIGMLADLIDKRTERL